MCNWTFADYLGYSVEHYSNNEIENFWPLNFLLKEEVLWERIKILETSTATGSWSNSQVKVRYRDGQTLWNFFKNSNEIVKFIHILTNDMMNFWPWIISQTRSFGENLKHLRLLLQEGADQRTRLKHPLLRDVRY